MNESSMKLSHFAVTIMGKDRPGIVAGAAEVLYRLGCNVEDSSCTMLAGEFAMILIVSHEKPFSKGKLMEEFSAFCEGMGLSVFIRSLKEDEVRYIEPSGDICVVAVYGSDRPGIVYRVTKALSERNVNITDLNTKLVGTAQEPVYVLILEAELTEETGAEELTAMLDKLKEELKVEISVRTVTPVSL